LGKKEDENRVITSNNHNLKYVNATFLLQKAVANLCQEGHIIFAASQIVNEGRDATFVDDLRAKGLLTTQAAQELHNLVSAYTEY
jgi:hypothetical protein